LIESPIKNLNQDIALPQLRIDRNKEAGLNNMARLLESMSIQFFKAVDIADLKSRNQIQVNYPAIDAADDGKNGGIAVQITSVADVKRINKTIATLEKKDAGGKCLKDSWRSFMIDASV